MYPIKPISSIYYVITKTTFWDFNFLKRDLKTFHAWLSSINVPVWLGAHGTVFQKLLLFHVLSMKSNTGCSVQKREPISAQQGGARGTLYSTSNSAQYKLLFQRREARASHLNPSKEVDLRPTKRWIAWQELCCTFILIFGPGSRCSVTATELSSLRWFSQTSLQKR